MKKVIFGLIATVMFANISFGQTFDDLKNSNNPSNSKGEEYYNFLNYIANSIKDKKISESEFNNIIKNSNFNFDIKLNESELNIYKSYFSNKDFNLKNLISFENYLQNEKLNVDKIKLLESIAYVKWFTLFSNDVAAKANGGGIGATVSAFENCLDRCMKKKLGAVFNQGNWVDQAGFIIGTPGTTGWMVASCSWDCF